MFTDFGKGYIAPIAVMSTLSFTKFCLYIVPLFLHFFELTVNELVPRVSFDALSVNYFGLPFLNNVVVVFFAKHKHSTKAAFHFHVVSTSD